MSEATESIAGAAHGAAAVVVDAASSAASAAADVLSTATEAVKSAVGASDSTPEVVEPRHSFYESDERLTLDIFDKGANPDEVKFNFEPRAFTYENGATKKWFAVTFFRLDNGHV